MAEPMMCVLLLGSGADWESAALTALNEHPGVVVLRRCVDVEDLLAAASTQTADLAVVGLDTPGLDAVAVEHLLRHRVHPVAVMPTGVEPDAARLRAVRIGLDVVVGQDRIDELAELVTTSRQPPAASSAPPPAELPAPVGPAAVPGGRLIAVWGPAGSPGRTTVAAGLAAEMGRRRLRTVLIDADPYGGAVAQHWGVLDEVSGLLSAARLSASGRLADHFGSVQRAMSRELTVVTGLPRADRWSELRSGTVEHIATTARDHGQVVVDTGFSLEEDPAAELSGRPARNAMTLGALDVADEIVVVGSADPVGLARLARGLTELRERIDARPVRVVVNRMRAGLGWSTDEVERLVAGFARVTGVHLLPEDRATLDRALVAGQTLAELGESPIGRALAEVVEAMFPGSGEPARRHRRRRAAAAAG